MLEQFRNISGLEAAHRWPVQRTSTSNDLPDGMADFMGDLFASDVGCPSFDDVQTCDISCITVQEVQIALKQMARGKSKDKSGIAMEIILHGGPEILEFLTSTFNGILMQRRIDDDWHVTFFTMLPKTGDLANPSNCRPIAILKVTYK